MKNLFYLNKFSFFKNKFDLDQIYLFYKQRILFRNLNPLRADNTDITVYDAFSFKINSLKILLLFLLNKK
jgi:hypothetical protein